MPVSNDVRVCVPLCEPTLDELRQSCVKVSSVADLIELRLDCLREFDPRTTFEAIQRVSKELSKPLIITFRPSEEGGQREIDLTERGEFWRSMLSANVDNVLFDIEYDLCSQLSELDSVSWQRVICSHHVFTETSESLENIYQRISATPARIVKIAVRADDMVDCLPIFKLMGRARNEGREVIAIAMGNAGIATRVLGPSRGTFLTYAAIQHGRGTAPGQLTVEDLNYTYRIKTIDRTTLVHGLVASAVKHSVSRHIHNAGFAAEGLNAVYLPFEVHDLGAFFDRMVHPGTRELDWALRGLSVTAPHKSAVMKHLDWIDPRAVAIGAINTIVVEDAALHGYNTDVEGFIEPLQQATGPSGISKAAVIGAGGAAKAVVWGLKEKGIEVVIFARNTEKARAAFANVNVSIRSLDSADFGGFDLVVNTTPLGTRGDKVDQTPATANQLRGVKLAYDLIYNPTDTRFLREAQAAGCQTLGGLEMLVSQAKLQFKLWTGKDAPESVMQAAAVKAVSSV